MNVLELPAHTPTRLITSPRDQRQPTRTRTTDALTALTRGVAEYVASLAPIQIDGKSLQFVGVFDAWAEPENDAEQYPRFVAYTNDEPVEYAQQSLSPTVSTVRYDDGTYEVSSASIEAAIKCEVWATDPETRKAMVLQLEEAFQPVEWMQGFRLELPHYFNQRATYLLEQVTYMGAATEAVQRFVNARLILRGAVPVTRVLPFVQARRVITELTVSSDPLPAAPAGVDVSGET